LKKEPPLRFRKAFAFLSVVGVLGAGSVVPAAATDVPTKPEVRPLPFVKATGDFYTSLNPTGRSVYFTCAGASGADSAATLLTECSIWVDGVFQANYPTGTSGNATVSTGRHDGPVGVVTLCFKAKAMFTNGSMMESARGCVSE
jgi:hypothetical protein